MIRMMTELNVACNSDAKRIMCFGINGSTGDNVAKVGDVVVVAVKEVKPGSKIKKGDKRYAVIVRTKGRIVRDDGSSVVFSDNAGVLVDPKTHEPIGTRVLGPVAREIKKNFPKIASLATEVL